MTFTLAQLEALFDWKLDKLLRPWHEVRDGAVFVDRRALSPEWLDEFWPDHRTNPPKLHVAGRPITAPVLGSTFTAEEFIAALDVLSKLHHDLTQRFTSAPPGVPKYLPGAPADEEGFHDPTTRNPEWVKGVLDEEALAALERIEPAFASMLRSMLCTRPDWWRNTDALKAWLAGPRLPWNDDRINDLRAYRQEHGTKAAAEHLDISGARVRKLDPGGRRKAEGYSVYTYRTK